MPMALAPCVRITSLLHGCCCSQRPVSPASCFVWLPQSKLPLRVQWVHPVGNRYSRYNRYNRYTRGCVQRG